MENLDIKENKIRRNINIYFRKNKKLLKETTVKEKKKKNIKDPYNNSTHKVDANNDLLFSLEELHNDITFSSKTKKIKTKI